MDVRDYKENWAPKNWCFWTVVLEKTLESPLEYKEIQPVNPKGNQSWIFMGKTDAEAETPILWPPDAKKWLIGKDPDAGKDWKQEEKGMREGEMVGWHHQLNGHEFGQALELVMDMEAWRAVHGVTKSWTQLSDWPELNLTKDARPPDIALIQISAHLQDHYFISACQIVSQLFSWVDLQLEKKSKFTIWLA